MGPGRQHTRDSEVDVGWAQKIAGRACWELKEIRPRLGAIFILVGRACCEHKSITTRDTYSQADFTIRKC